MEMSYRGIIGNPWLISVPPGASRCLMWVPVETRGRRGSRGATEGPVTANVWSFSSCLTHAGAEVSKFLWVTSGFQVLCFLWIASSNFIPIEMEEL